MQWQSQGDNLWDRSLDGLGGPRTQAFLNTIDAAIPWELLAEPVEATYSQSNTGRPHWPAVLMLKCVFLQKWFNLSDPGLEEALLDRLSFRRFVGLSQGDPTPDETTLVRFRKRLLDHGLANDLFERAKGHLQQQGLIVQEGTAVDATIIHAPRGRERADGLSNSTDRCASTTVKHGEVHHGYKAHVATDVNSIIVDYVYDTAKVHDSQHMDQLIEGETQAVFGDSAYMDKTRKARLEEQGIFCGIIERRVRGQAELRPEQKRHNRLCSQFRAAVELPFAWLKNTGGFLTVRYRGLQRNALDFCLAAIAYNFRRSLSIAAEMTELAQPEPQ